MKEREERKGREVNKDSCVKIPRKKTCQGVGREEREGERECVREQRGSIMKYEFVCEKEWKEWRKSQQICERENTEKRKQCRKLTPLSFNV